MGSSRRITRVRRTAASTCRFVGLAMVLFVVNGLLGFAWDQVSNGEASTDPGQMTGAPLDLGPAGPVSTTVPSEPDPRVRVPAMADAPWAEDYFREVRSSTLRYGPYTLLENRDVRLEYVNITDGERHSYRAGSASTAAPMPVVTFYGGSTMWGEGQRDEFTVASYVARLAEEAGIPVEVRNRGVRGVSLMQEYVLYGNRLAGGERSDLVVFYDGLNECDIQAALPPEFRGNPAHFEVDDVAARVERDADDATEDPADVLARSWQRYERHSLAHKLVGKAGDLLGGEPAGATDHEETAEDCVDVYERVRGRVLARAEQADEPIRMFWQPTRGWDRPGWYGSEAAARVSPPTVGIMDAFDGVAEDDLFIDGGHTNERGARLVAEAMWPHLRPVIQQWYDDNA